MNNMKQCYLGFMGYRDDGDNSIMGNRNDRFVFGTGYDFFNRYLTGDFSSDSTKYLDYEILLCPSYPPQTFTNGVASYASYIRDPHKYSVMSNLLETAGGYNPGPTEVVLLCDSLRQDAQLHVYNGYAHDPDTSVHLLHQYRENFLFADGHVETLGRDTAINTLQKADYSGYAVIVPFNPLYVVEGPYP